MSSYFQDVAAFNAKFGLPNEDEPEPSAPLSPDVLSFRLAFMIEELAEFAASQGAETVAVLLRKIMNEMRDGRYAADPPIVTGLADGGDALVDLVYVALGTAHLMRLPFEEMWAEVQRANMEKERAVAGGDARSKRGHDLDVVKPAGWRGPDHWPLIYARGTAVRTEEQRQALNTNVQAQVLSTFSRDLCYCAHDRTGHERGAQGCLHHMKHL